jgi:hypothetical protein
MSNRLSGKVITGSGGVSPHNHPNRELKGSIVMLGKASIRYLAHSWSLGRSVLSPGRRLSLGKSGRPY